MSERRGRRSGLRLLPIIGCSWWQYGGWQQGTLILPWHETPRTIGEEKHEPWPIWEPE